jgi:hypothetical protein
VVVVEEEERKRREAIVKAWKRGTGVIGGISGAGTSPLHDTSSYSLIDLLVCLFFRLQKIRDLPRRLLTIKHWNSRTVGI